MSTGNNSTTVVLVIAMITVLFVLPTHSRLDLGLRVAVCTAVHSTQKCCGIVVSQTNCSFTNEIKNSTIDIRTPRCLWLRNCTGMPLDPVCQVSRHSTTNIRLTVVWLLQKQKQLMLAQPSRQQKQRRVTAKRRRRQADRHRTACAARHLQRARSPVG